MFIKIILFLFVLITNANAGIDFTLSTDKAQSFQTISGSKVYNRHGVTEIPHLGHVDPYGNPTHPTKRGWCILKTSYNQVEATLGFTMVDYIKEDLEERGLNILFWGCGAGKAANDIAEALDRAKGDEKFQIVGFGDMSFPDWNYSDPSVSYILGTLEDLENTPTPKFDIIMSHFGLFHLEQEELVDHMKALRVKLKPGGVVVFNVKWTGSQYLVDLSPYYEIDTYPMDHSYTVKLRLKDNGAGVRACSYPIRSK